MSSCTYWCTAARAYHLHMCLYWGVTSGGSLGANFTKFFILHKARCPWGEEPLHCITSQGKQRNGKKSQRKVLSIAKQIFEEVASHSWHSMPPWPILWLCSLASFLPHSHWRILMGREKKFRPYNLFSWPHLTFFHRHFVKTQVIFQQQQQQKNRAIKSH